METYTSYKDARNLAWEILIKFELYKFPIDPKKLAKQLNIHVNQREKIPNDYYSISFLFEDEPYIIYKSSGNEETDRFTITHEIGHILMKNFESDRKPNQYEEEQANVFASRLLAPMIVLKHHNFKSFEQVSDFFGISLESACIRFKRYKEIDKRNAYLLHPLERDYYFHYCVKNGFDPIRF